MRKTRWVLEFRAAIPMAMTMAMAVPSDDRLMAQEPAPSGVDLHAFAERRHPQPVRVGQLLHRRVLRPLESRPILGHVAQVVHLGGTNQIIMTYGGWFGFGGRSIAVPVDAMVLLGDELEVLDFTPEQLNRFPTYDGTGEGLASDQFIRMGLAHPSH